MKGSILITGNWIRIMRVLDKAPSIPKMISKEAKIDKIAVYKMLYTLENRGMVSRSNKSYQLTLKGRDILQTHDKKG